MMAEVPRLDFSRFSQGTKQEKEEFGEALTKALIEHGFVKLVNHGIADEAVVNLLEQVKDLTIRSSLGQLWLIGFFFGLNKYSNLVTQILQSACARLATDCLCSRPKPTTWLVRTRH